MYIALFKVLCPIFLYVLFPTLLCLLPWGVACILLTQTNIVMLFCLAIYFRYEVVYGNSTFYSKEFLGTFLMLLSAYDFSLFRTLNLSVCFGLMKWWKTLLGIVLHESYTTQADSQNSNAKQAIEFVFLHQAIHMVLSSGEKLLEMFCFPSRMVHYFWVIFPHNLAPVVCSCVTFNLQSMIPSEKVEYLLSFFLLFFNLFRKKCTSEAADLRPCRNLLYQASASVG